MIKNKITLLILIFSTLILNGLILGGTDESSKLQPERIILNPTRDPAHEQAVTWRSNTRLEEPSVQLAPARNGVDLEDYSRNISAKCEQVSISNTESPWHYSAVVKRLVAKMPQRLGS